MRAPQLLCCSSSESSSPSRRWALRGRCLARGAVRFCSCLFRRGVTLRSRDCTFALSESSYGRLSAKVRAARREAAEACAVGSTLSGCAVMAPGFGFAPHHTSARICSACAREDQEAPRRRRTRRQQQEEASPFIKLHAIRLQSRRSGTGIKSTTCTVQEGFDLVPFGRALVVGRLLLIAIWGSCRAARR